MLKNTSTFSIQTVKEGDVVRSLVIHAADDVILTQTPAAVADGVCFVPESADVQVYGHVVRLLGPIRLPGRRVTLHARQILAEFAKSEPAALIVDGKAGALRDPQATVVQSKSKSGPGRANRVHPIPAPPAPSSPSPPALSSPSPPAPTAFLTHSSAPPPSRRAGACPPGAHT